MFLSRSLLTIQNIIVHDKIFIVANTTIYSLIISLNFCLLSLHITLLLEIIYLLK